MDTSNIKVKLSDNQLFEYNKEKGVYEIDKPENFNENFYFTVYDDTLSDNKIVLYSELLRTIDPVPVPPVIQESGKKSNKLAWWAILLIVIGCLLGAFLIFCFAFYFLYAKYHSSDAKGFTDGFNNTIGQILDKIDCCKLTYIADFNQSEISSFWSFFEVNSSIIIKIFRCYEWITFSYV